VDREIRELERRFTESGILKDEIALLLAKFRAGRLSLEQLAAAAQMEHPAALAISHTIFRPFQGGGVPQYEALEEFLFELFKVSPDLPYRLGLAYLRQTLPIFDTNPYTMLERFNQVTHYQLETPFSDLSREYINIFQQWLEAFFGTRDEERAELATLVRSEQFQTWFDAAGVEFVLVAGYFELEQPPTASFYNAANAFHNYIRALTNSYDKDSRVTPGEILASLQHLRLSINSVVDSVIEASEISNVYTFSHESWVAHRNYIQQTILRRVRTEIIPLLLG